MMKILLTKDEISQVKMKLECKSDIILSTFKEETNFSSEHIKFMWNDLISFMNGFEILKEKTLNKWDNEKKSYQIWEPNSQLVRIPWGRVLLCSPGNAPIPLIPILIISFAIFGNEIVLCPSKKTLRTAKILFDILESSLGSKNSMIFYSKGGENALQEFVDTGKIDLLYFQGGSKFRDDIYKRAYSNGVDVIYEGEGSVVSVIGKSVDKNRMKEITRNLFDSKTFCSGQVCTSPSTIFVPNTILPEFMTEFARLSENYSYLPLLKTNQIDWIRSLIQDGLSKGDIKQVSPKEYVNENGVKPSLIEISNIGCTSNFINIELFSPLMFCIGYEAIDDVIVLLKENWRYGLQLSLFSNDKQENTKIIESVGTARITQNMNPCYQNSLLPWGGYKLSGHSYVLNFLEKATRPTVIEGNIVDNKVKN